MTIDEKSPAGLPAWVKLVREDLSAYEQQILTQAPLRNADLAFAFLKERAKHEEVEVNYAIALDSFGRILGAWEAARGGPTEVASIAREVFRPAIALGATAVICAHNHPNNDETPSRDDLRQHIKMGAAAAALDMRYLDSLVLAGDSYTSIHRHLAAHQDKLKMLTIEFIVHEAAEAVGADVQAGNGPDGAVTLTGRIPRHSPQSEDN